jgi:hypothetical protein
MLNIEQKTYTNLADLMSVSVYEPEDVAFSRLHNKLDPEAEIRLDDVTIRLYAGPKSMRFCRDLLEVAKEAVAWLEDSRCTRCAANGHDDYSVRLNHGDMCPDCAAEVRATEHEEVA